jgi:hypothetical protein
VAVVSLPISISLAEEVEVFLQEMASSAVIAFGRSGRKLGRDRWLLPCRKRQNVLPNSPLPLGSTEVGMKELLPSMISPITWSADKVRIMRRV